MIPDVIAGLHINHAAKRSPLVIASMTFKGHAALHLTQACKKRKGPCLILSLCNVIDPITA